MLPNLSNELKFRIERLVLRGAHYRLLVIAALIGLISISAGTIIHYFDAGFPGADFGDAVWWSFLRLTDPGYLGDDTGTLERVVSTFLTVLGYVVFLGALVAILTQWLNERMHDLEAGLTPIAQRDHVLIVGWTNRTAAIVRELVLSEGRVRRFLRHRGARRLRIAILADAVSTALSVELRDRLGSLWNERQVILRTGSPLRVEHLHRVDFARAAAVILPASDFRSGGPSQADTRAIKTLLSMGNHPQRDGAPLPLAVAEIFDSRKTQVARRAYSGPVEILASDAIISRLIAQNVRHRGLSRVYGELLTHGRGNELYIRDTGELQGLPFHRAARAFPDAILLGTVSPEDDSYRTLLNPAMDTLLRSDDRLVLLARSYAAVQAITRVAPDRVAPAPAPARPAVPGASPRSLRLLVLGWSHKVPALLRELDSYADDSFEIDLVSTAPAAERAAALLRFDFAPSRITHRLIDGDYTVPSVLERMEPAGYDNIVLLGTDRVGSGEESDARSILAYLLLRDILPADDGPALLIELLDAGNVSLFRERRGEVIISPVILSHMLAQVALRRELRAVFDELFGPAGAEITFRPAGDFALGAAPVTFEQIEGVAAARGEIVLGVRAASGVTLNPPRTRTFQLVHGDDLVMLR